MTLSSCGGNEINPNDEDSVLSGSSLHSLVLDRHGTALTEMTFLGIYFAFFCLMKVDSVSRMFPFTKRDSREWNSR